MTRLPADFLRLPIAHRTLHDITDGRPENSVEGAAAAIRAGYAMEIDVQLTADNRAVVFHDYTLDRLTGHSGRVIDMTLDRIGRIKLLHGASAPIGLSSFLDLVGGRVPVLIELKDRDNTLSDRVGPLERDVCAAVAVYRGPVALMSFNPHSVALCADLAPDVARGLVTDPMMASDWPDVADDRRRALSAIPDYDRVGACFISHNVAHLDTPPVRRVRDTDGAILTWTVRSAEQERRARLLADNITFENYLPAIPEC